MVGRSKTTSWWGKWQVLIPAGSFLLVVASGVVVYARNTDPEKIATKEFVRQKIEESENGTTATMNRCLDDIKTTMRQQTDDIRQIRDCLMPEKSRRGDGQ